jgi:hypothetical protein
MEDFDSLNEKQLESLERGLSDLKNNRVMTSDEFWKELLSNKEQQLLIDEAYENYCKEYSSLYYLEDKIEYGYSDYHHDIEDYSFEAYTQEEFIHRCKTDSEFSEKWGLKVEERELSLEERAYAYNNLLEKQNYNPKWQSKIKDIDKLNEGELMTILQSLPGPSKLITLSYHDKTITSCE